MAGKININPEAIKGNLDLIIVTVATVGLLGYGWLQLGATEELRTTSAGDLEKLTGDYNKNKNYPIDENILTNANGGTVTITTDESHGNLARIKVAGTNFVSHLDRVRKKFAPLDIPDGIVLDEKTGAILSVTLMQGGTNSNAEPPAVQVISNKGKGAKLVASTRSHGGDGEFPEYYVEKIDVVEGGSGYTRGDIAIIIGDGAGGGAMSDPGMSTPGQVDDPGQMPAPPMQTAMGMGSGGVGGDHWAFNGKQYVVADPTYINADVGMTIPRYAGVTPDISAF